MKRAKAARLGGSHSADGPRGPGASLRAVASDEPELADARPAGPGRVARIGPLGLLAAALAVVSLLLVSQYQRADQLDGLVETLGAELEAARQELVVQQRRMGLVRGHVEDLSSRVEALGRLVAAEGGAEAD